MALAKDRNTRTKGVWSQVSYKVAAATTIYAGAMVAVNAAGYAVPAAKTAGLVVVGRAAENVINAGDAGAASVRVDKGIFAWANDANAVTQADIGRACYVVDDQTVADETEGSAIPAGVVDSIDPSGEIWVRTSDAPAVEASAIETVTEGALSLHTRTSLISVTGTKAYTLAAGLYEGQRKSIRCTVAASDPDGTLTPVLFADGTSLDIDAVGEAAEIEWHAASGWNLINLVGATVNA